MFACYVSKINFLHMSIFHEDTRSLASLYVLVTLSLNTVVQYVLQKNSGLLYSLQKTFPRICQCLSMLSASKRKCLICQEKEQKNFIACDTPGCDFVYCPECWLDIKVSPTWSY